MIRREFLVRTLSAAVASLFARGAFAQQSMHGMQGMSGMNGMQGMQGMSDMPDMPHAGTSQTVELAGPETLPSGAPLAPLRKLANESREPGVFRATLVAQA